jgi:hypothetical protein
MDKMKPGQRYRYAVVGNREVAWLEIENRALLLVVDDKVKRDFVDVRADIRRTICGRGRGLRLRGSRGRFRHSLTGREWRGQTER